jgi:phosphoribosylamine---glycine ligase
VFMRVLVVGSGGREHALIWKLSQSPKISALFCAPGNGGISSSAHCVDLQATDVVGLLGFAKKERIELVVVGPENALSVGLVDEFEKIGVPAFGPSKRGSMIETSKVFSKLLLKKYEIPTASFQVFDTYDRAVQHIRSIPPPYVVKADGLCAGKGAFVIKDFKEGEAALKELLLDKVHGEAGNKVVIEDFLPGSEVSYLAFSDGSTVLSMLPSQDHKTLLDNDKGPNTGGMGAYAPVPQIDPVFEGYVDDNIMQKTIDALRHEGINYKGILYAGLMVHQMRPSVLEFNARFGDPETQPLLFKMDSDLLPLLVGCIQGNLKDMGPISWKKGVSLCVVMASRGYPGKPEEGHLISGLEDLENLPGVYVFHAGTKKINNKYYTAGGRVLGVTVIGDNYMDAIDKVYNAVSCVKFDGMQYRMDIARKAVLTKPL